MKIKIYTDGACSNPGKGGWAAIILDNALINMTFRVRKIRLITEWN